MASKVPEHGYECGDGEREQVVKSAGVRFMYLACDDGIDAESDYIDDIEPNELSAAAFFALYAPRPPAIPVEAVKGCDCEREGFY